jgi:hypothetical protein
MKRTAVLKQAANSFCVSTFSFTAILSYWSKNGLTAGLICLHCLRARYSPSSQIRNQGREIALCHPVLQCCNSDIKLLVKSQAVAIAVVEEACLSRGFKVLEHP